MFCGQCGKENPDSGKFCWSCGNSLIRQQDNPRPSTVEPSATPITAVRDGGKLIVPRQDAVLPQGCVKCGAVADFHPYKFAWLNPGYIGLLLLGIWPYFIIRLFLRKTTKLRVPLCERHYNRYHGLGIAAAVALVASIPVGFLVASLAGEPDGAIWGFFSGFAVALVGLILIWAHYPLRATQIDAQKAVFTGAGERFLQLLPPRQT